MLTVRDLMEKNPATVTPDMPMQNLIRLMQASGCKQVAVLDANQKLIGIITHRDCCLVANIPILDDMNVADCMTANPISVTADTPAFRAAKMLSTYKFGALPVVEKGNFVGMITTAHFLQYFASKEEAQLQH